MNHDRPVSGAIAIADAVIGGALLGFAKIARDRTEENRAEIRLESLPVREREMRAVLQPPVSPMPISRTMSQQLKQPLHRIHVNAEPMSGLPGGRRAPSPARAGTRSAAPC